MLVAAVGRGGHLNNSNRPKKSVIAAVASSSTYGLLTIGANLLLLPLIFATIGTGPYGVWLLLTTLAVYLYQSDLGMGAATVRFLALKRDQSHADDRDAIVSTSFVWVAGMGLAATAPFAIVGWLLASPLLNGAGLSEQDGILLVLIASALVALLGLRAFPPVLQGLGYWALERQLQTGGVLLRVAGIAAVCLLAPDVVFLAAVEVIALLSAPLATCLVVLFQRLGAVRFSVIRRSLFKELIGFSVKSFAVGATGSAILQVGTIAIGVTGGADQVSYYNAAFRVYTAVRQVIGWTVDPFLPGMTRAFKAGIGWKRAAEGLLFSTFGLAVLICVPLSLVSPLVLTAWLGSEIPIDQVSLSLQILCIGLMANATHLPATPIANAIGRPGYFLPLHLVWLAMTTALSFSLGAPFGVMGIALAVTAPLLVLEPLYIGRVMSLLDLSVAGWFRGAISGVLQSSVAAGSIAIAAFLTGSAIWDATIGACIAAVCYCLVSLAVYWLLARRGGLDNLKGTIRVGA